MLTIEREKVTSPLPVFSVVTASNHDNGLNVKYHGLTKIKRNRSLIILEYIQNVENVETTVSRIAYHQVLFET